VAQFEARQRQIDEMSSAMAEEPDVAAAESFLRDFRLRNLSR